MSVFFYEKLSKLFLAFCCLLCYTVKKINRKEESDMLKNMGYGVSVTEYIVIKPNASYTGAKPTKPPQ